MKNALRLSVAACLLTAVGAAQAATISLADWAYYVDGIDVFPTDFYSGPAAPLPSSIDDSAFDYSDGVGGTPGGFGSIVFTVTGAGAHTVAALFDHDIDDNRNTFFNETGRAVNESQLPAGLAWEIDRPTFGRPIPTSVPASTYTGDFVDTYYGTLLLDNQVFFDGVSTYVGTMDVAMAFVWDFVLAAGQTGIVEMVLSDARPTDGFYLEHLDPNSGVGVFMTTALSIIDPNAVPEPTTPLLLAGGLFLLVARRRAGR